MEPIYAAVDALMDVDVGEVTDGPLDDLALRLDALRRITGKARELADAVELQLIDSMPADELVIPHVGKLKRAKYASTRVAQNGTRRLRSDLGIAVARKLGTDPFTGEVSDTRRTVAREAVALVIEVVSITASSVKAAAEDALGLSPSDYLVTTHPYRIEIEGEDEP